VNEVPKLTERETQVRDLILCGLVHKEIAAALGISDKTVQIHASKLYRKYGVARRGKLVAKLAEERHNASG
jgi:DNA-binding NarL/FixJ family response regulator